MTKPSHSSNKNGSNASNYNQKEYINYVHVDEGFLNYLEFQNYIIHDIDGDGNCLFRTVSHQIENDDQNHTFFRVRVVTFLERNKDSLKNFISNGDKENAFENYLEKMLQNGTWGDHVEILALSGVMKVRFVVVKDDRQVIIINYEDMDPNRPKNPQIPTYYLAFAQKQMHYFSIKKKSN